MHDVTSDVISGISGYKLVDLRQVGGNTSPQPGLTCRHLDYVMSRAIRGTRFCFTVNNYTTQGYERLKLGLQEPCKYATIGKETGDSGTPHLQGFCIFKKTTTITKLNGIIYNGTKIHGHTEVARGTNQEASAYCQKDGIFWEHGVLPKGRGSRTDISAYLNDIKDGMDDTALAEEHPDCFAKYQRAKENLRVSVKNKNNKIKMRNQFLSAKLRGWQKIVIRKLSEQSDRTITWVFDPDGNIGKSWLANYLVAIYGAYLVEGGRRADIAYAYNYEPIVVFDFTRSQEEQVNYSIIESFKNGRLFSSKYDSQLKIFEAAFVLCLSNFDPDRTKLSKDRWQVLQFPYEKLAKPPTTPMKDAFTYPEDVVTCKCTSNCNCDCKCHKILN